MAYIFRLPHAWSFFWRATLVAVCLSGMSRLLAGELSYSAGMAATSAQESVNALTNAAMAYPYEYRFRTAQAKQLFALAKRFPELIPAANTSLGYALQADPGSLELASAIYLTQCALGDKMGTARAAYRVRVLGHDSARVEKLIVGGC